MSEEFEEAVMKKLDNIDNEIMKMKNILECEIKMRFSILNKSNELIYKINKQNKEKIKSIENIIIKH